MPWTVRDLLEHHHWIIFNTLVIKCVIAWHLNVFSSKKMREKRKKKIASKMYLNIRLKLYIILHLYHVFLWRLQASKQANEGALHFRKDFRSLSISFTAENPWWKTFFFTISSFFFVSRHWWKIKQCLNIWKKNCGNIIST